MTPEIINKALNGSFGIGRCARVNQDGDVVISKDEHYAVTMTLHDLLIIIKQQHEALEKVMTNRPIKELQDWGVYSALALSEPYVKLVEGKNDQ